MIIKPVSALNPPSKLVFIQEYLGQGIAYARMNGVTPPWSEKQEGEG